jgi:hypothetical protein
MQSASETIPVVFFLLFAVASCNQSYSLSWWNLSVRLSVHATAMKNISKRDAKVEFVSSYDSNFFQLVL